MAGRKTKRIAMAGWVSALGMSAIEIASASAAPVTETVAEVTAPVTKPGAFSPTMRLQEVVEHPDFRGFGRHFLPRPGETYNGDVLLNRTGDLLPHYSNVQPQEVVSSLDRLACDVRTGQQVFHVFYNAEEIEADPAKADTGIFFLQGKSQAPFAIIAFKAALLCRDRA